MLEPMYTAKDICGLFKLKDERTARKIMREMEHLERPVLMVSERAVRAWMAKQMLPPESEMRRMMKRKGA